MNRKLLFSNIGLYKPMLVSVLVGAFLCYGTGYAQEKKTTDRFNWLNLSGFINYNAKYDTRQNVAARDGEVYLFPKPVELDDAGKDVNDFGRLQMFTFHSRLKFGVSGPDFHGFKTSGLLSFDFLGTNDDNASLARIRHAFVKLSKEKFDILFGQTWHPTFVPSCFPEILDWGAAVTVQPFNRSPQIRLTYRPTSSLSMLVAMLSQRDFSDRGPNGATGEYLRNAGSPEIQASAILKASANFEMGVVGGYKTIAPRLKTNTGLAHKETISSYNIGGYAKVSTDDFFLKLHTIYGQNLSNMLLVSGYYVKDVDPVTDYRTYENLHTFSLWGETQYKINDFAIALFAGFVKAPDNEDIITNVNDVTGTSYGLGTNIESLYKISPRITYTKNKVRFGVELMTTKANYLDKHTDEVETWYDGTSSVTNNRIMFSTYLFF